MTDTMTFHKLIVLYMLSRVDFPLTRNQIGDFLTEREYTQYLALQQAIGELLDAGFVAAESARNRTHLTITPEGRQTLSFFGNQLHYSVREDVDKYLRENNFRLRNEVSVWSDYTKTASGEYSAHLVAKDRGNTLIDLTLCVPLEETASSICENWQSKNQEIYQYLVSQLF